MNKLRKRGKACEIFDPLFLKGKENNIEHQAYIYPEVNHGFHNNTTPRYDKEAANLSWERTIDFFKKHLK